VIGFDLTLKLTSPTKKFTTLNIIFPFFCGYFLCIYQLATLIKISTLKDGKLAPITFGVALVNVNASNYKSLMHLPNNVFYIL
jgi:hypothetical protein